MAIALVAAIFLSFAPLLVPGPVMPFEHLPSLVFSTAALIAIFTYKQTRGKADQENIRYRSELFFGQASKGLDEVLVLLSDLNNSRIIWIRAARSLLIAKKLAKKIELEQYKQEYDLYENRIRNDLYLALTIPGENPNQRKPLPSHFFFGLPDWEADSKAEKTLDEVAIKASYRIEAYRVTLDKMPPEPSLYPLAEKSVIAIFDFLKYPDDFEDPLDEVEEWKADWTAVFGEKMGAARYIHHRKTKGAVDGRLYDIEENEPGKEA